VYKKTQILLQYETAHWVPNMKMLLIMLVKFGILGKEPKKKKDFTFCVVVLKFWFPPNEERRNLFDCGWCRKVPTSVVS